MDKWAKTKEEEATKQKQTSVSLQCMRDARDMRRRRCIDT
jgi:hypothetical protein